MKKRLLNLMNLRRALMLSAVVMTLFAMPTKALADDYVASVTIGETTTDYATLVDAVTAANGAASDATVSLLDDVALDDTYLTFNNTHKITLDLNGKKITGSASYVVKIAAGADVTIIGGDNSEAAGIFGIGNNGVDNEGTLAVSSCTISGPTGITNHRTAVLTIGANVTIKEFTIIGISNSGSLKLNAIPAFTDANNTNGDIELAASYDIDDGASPYQPITFGTGLTAPTNPVRVMAYDLNVDHENVEAALPFVFTKGYKAAFTSGDPATTVDPASVFTVSGATVVLAGGEAVAYDTNKPLVAVKTDADGSITGLYAKDGTTYTTEADALRAAVNALADGETLTLCKDVDFGDDGMYLWIKKGTAAQPVTIDLNGKKITVKREDCVLVVGDGNSTPTVIIKNGTIENSHTETGHAIMNYGNLTISGISATGYAAITNTGTGTITIASGTITANGSNGVGLDNSGTLTMSGGSVTGYYGIRNLGVLTVSGGTVEGKGSFAIENYSNATSCTIGAATIKSDNNLGISAEVNVTLTAWPTFSGNSTDIDLLEDVKIVLGDGFAVPATEFNKMKVKAVGDVPFSITSGYAAHCKDGQSNVIDPASVFTWTGENSYVFLLDGDEVKVGNSVLLPTITREPTAKTDLVFINMPQKLIEPGAVINGTMFYRCVSVPNYSDKDDLTGASVDITIDDKDAKVDKVTIAQDATVEIGISIVVNGIKWSTAIPTGTQLGEYTVAYMVKGDEGYGDIPEKTLKVTIASTVGTKVLGDNTVAVTGLSNEMKALIAKAQGAGEPAVVAIPAQIDDKPVTNIAAGALTGLSESVTIRLPKSKELINFEISSVDGAQVQTPDNQLGQYAEQPGLLETLLAGNLFARMTSNYEVRTYSNGIDVNIPLKHTYSYTVKELFEQSKISLKDYIKDSKILVLAEQTLDNIKNEKITVNITTTDYLQAYKCNVMYNGVTHQQEVVAAPIVMDADGQNMHYCKNNGVLLACNVNLIMDVADQLVDKQLDEFKLTDNLGANVIKMIKTKVKDFVLDEGTKLVAKYTTEEKDPTKVAKFVQAEGAASDYAPNMLWPMIKGQNYKNDDEFTYYALKDKQFKKIADSDTEAPVSRALLKVPTSMVTVASARSLSIRMEDDEATGIIGIGQKRTDTDGDRWYTISGQRIQRPTKKGLYIHNGVKEVVK